MTLFRGRVARISCFLTMRVRVRISILRCGFQQQIKPRECRLWRTWERKEVAPGQPRFGSRIETSCMCQTLPSGSLNKARER
jgi:hypothetical protein